MWVELTETDVATALSGPEYAAYTSAALRDGQASPLPEVITQVVRQVRGHVAACAQNRLGAGLSIPDELRATALDLIAWRLATRLPLGSSLMERIEKRKDDAERLLRDVSRCQFAIEQPEEVADEVTAGPSVQVVSSRPTLASRDDLSGL